MDFKSFKESHANSNDRIDREKIKKTAEAYRGKSDEELLAEIINMANRGKVDGTFSEEQLRRFTESVSPMLSEEQKQRLQTVSELLKKS